ncbi:PGG domain [Sesbania bispinosa]|nr:PGG domain [Sesbania bispinosa]
MTLNFLFLSLNLFGGFCRLVLNFLLRPVKLLGQLLLGIVSIFVHIFKCLKISGIRDIYDQKYTHYEVLGILYYFCRSISDFNQSQLLEASAYDAMLRAAQHGITEFIKAMGMANSVLLSASDEFKRGIFSHAILNRKQNVFQLLHGLDERKELFDFYKDIFGNNLLHLAAHLGPLYDPDSRPGAALQMQREIQWFKAVEELVHPVCKEVRNYDGRKPHELFTETHEELVKDGEKWAKGTAKSLTLVGILITTIVFAAAFTVPGGYNQETGVPIFLHDKLFIAFLITDAISLFTSAASVLIFAGILTSRYAEKDFLTSLPSKLLFGLSFLFLSVIFMIVAFGAALVVTILKGYRSYRWFVIGPTLFLGSVPLVVLVVSQWGLMYEIFQSTRKNPISYI